MRGGDGEWQDEHEGGQKSKRYTNGKVTPSLVSFNNMAWIRQVTVTQACLDLNGLFVQAKGINK